jgi:hypothetical protein
MIMVACLIFHSSCKKWDPNLQCSTDILSQKKSHSKNFDNLALENREVLKIGQSWSEVSRIIGNDYRILATLQKEGSNWLKIEIPEENNITNNSVSRTELLFKNSILLKIERL